LATSLQKHHTTQFATGQIEATHRLHDLQDHYRASNIAADPASFIGSRWTALENARRIRMLLVAESDDTV